MFSTNRVKKKPLNEGNILAKVSEHDIFRYYIGDFKVGSIFRSPLHDDVHPSFGVFVGKTDNRMMFNDYVEGGGTCFVFVMKLFNVDYWTALNIINNDMKIGLQSSSKVSRVEKKFTPTNYKPSRSAVTIAIKKREWNSNDGLYWKEQFQINYKTLLKFNVYPISHYYLNGVTIKTGPLAYAYHLDKGTFKIYQPNIARNEGKFFTNVSISTMWQGVRQLPKSGDILFITSSLKDVMALYEAGFSAIAPHTEKQELTDRIFNYYKKRWKHIVILYDYDDAGLKHAKKWHEKFNIPFITTESQMAKDPSDYAKMNSVGLLRKLITDKLKKYNIDVPKENN